MVTSTDITERGAVTRPDYTARGAVSSPTMTARGAVTNPYYKDEAETQTDQTAPTISNFHANAISRTYAEFDWDTNEPATCHIQYGTSEPVGGTDTIVTHAHLVVNGRSVIAVGLSKGTTYYIEARSTDAYGNTSPRGTYYVFTTADVGDGGGAPEPTA